MNQRGSSLLRLRRMHETTKKYGDFAKRCDFTVLSVFVFARCFPAGRCRRQPGQLISETAAQVLQRVDDHNAVLPNRLHHQNKFQFGRDVNCRSRKAAAASDLADRPESAVSVKGMIREERQQFQNLAS